jgi:polyhydroxybutyrate depolymerase
MERSSGLSRLADRAGFVVAYPSATGPHAFWNLGPPVAGHAADDVAFADALIRRLVASGCIDRTRIYAVGVSNGGGLAARLGCERASELAAVVTVAGTYGHLESCRPAQPVSVLEIHGTDDRSVPYRGDPEDGYRGAVRTWLAKWAREDGCRTSPRRAIVAPRTARLDWGPCASGTAVGHLELYGEGHVWPGADPPDPGAASPVSAAWETWRFVASHRLVPAP